jgi:hypothetical protein
MMAITLPLLGGYGLMNILAAQGVFSPTAAIGAPVLFSLPLALIPLLIIYSLVLARGANLPGKGLMLAGVRLVRSWSQTLGISGVERAVGQEIVRPDKVVENALTGFREEAGRIRYNLPILFHQLGWRDAFPRMRELWIMGQALGRRVLMGATAANRVDISDLETWFNNSPVVQDLVTRAWNADAAELRHKGETGQLSFQALSRPKALWEKGPGALLMGQRLTDPKTGKAVVSVPVSIMSVLTQNQAWNPEQYQQAEELFKLMLSFHRPGHDKQIIKHEKLGSQRRITRTLMPGRKEINGLLNAIRALGRRINPADYYPEQESIILTAADVYRIYVYCMKNLGQANFAHAKLVEHFAGLLNSGAGLNLRAFSAAAKEVKAEGDPVITAMQGLVADVENIEDENLQKVIASGLMGSLLDLISSKPGEVLTKSSVAWDDKSFTVTGIPKKTAAIMRDALAKVRTKGMTENMQNLVEALIFVLNAQSGQGLEQAAEIEAEAGSALAEAKLRLEKSMMQAEVLGTDSSGRKVRCVCAGLEPVKTGLGEIGRLLLLDSNSSSMNIEKIIAQAIKGEYGVLGLFDNFAIAPQPIAAAGITRNRLAARLLSAGKSGYVPISVSRVLDGMVRKIAPVYWVWQNLQASGKGLPENSRLSNLGGMSLDQCWKWLNSGDPKAETMRAMLHSADPRHEALMARTWLGLIYPARLAADQSVQIIRNKARQMQELSFVSQFFTNMTSVFTVLISRGDVKLAVPIAMFQEVGFKGIIGAVADKMEKMGIEVRYEIIDLFMRQRQRLWNSVNIAA